MKKQIQLLLAFSLIGLSSAIFAQTPNHIWSHGFQSDFKNIYSTVDPIGNYYIATEVGDGWGSISINPQAWTGTTYISGQWTAVVAKYNSNGNFIWMNDYAHPNGIGSAANGVIINGIDLNSNNEIILTGSFTGTFDFDLGPGTASLTSNGDYDAFVLKLDNNGGLIWVKQIGTINADNSNALTVDNNNNIIISGTYSGAIDLDPNGGTNTVNSYGAQDIFIVKLDNNGGFLYGKSIGGVSVDAPTKLAHTSTNDIILTGWCYNSNGDFNPDGGVTPLTYNGSTGNFILKLDNLGTFQFVKAFGDVSNSNIKELKIDQNDNFIISGNYSNTSDLDPATDTVNYTSLGNQDIFILQMNSTGTTNWIKTIGSIESEDVLSMTINANNEIIFGAQFIGTVDFNPGPSVFNLTTNATYFDGAFVTLNSSGVFSNAYNFNVGNGAISISSVVTDNSNNILSAGVFYGTADFDFGSGVSNLNSVANNLFIAKWGNTVTGIISLTGDMSGIKIYPNPSKDLITIEKSQSSFISILNYIGQEVYSKQIQNKETIDISKLEEGVYFLRDNTSGKSTKFIKQ